ncbi:MAG: hypothetical protein NC483_04660 [Ruminococcus sp.]|nr:hypothetical protein [Ruminococcus sp.]
MEIIGHTSFLNKTTSALEHYLISSSCLKLEMDFVLTKDGKLVWTHSPIFERKIISRTEYKKLSSLITLEEVLEILNGNISILIEIKYFDGFNYSMISRLLKALEVLKFYNGEISLQSFNSQLVSQLLAYKNELSCDEIGLIVNLFKVHKYKKENIKLIDEIDFLSLSSELWEWTKIKENYLYFRNLFPKAREYAWTWELLYKENARRINNYIDKNPDGIITTEPALVRSLIR